MGADTFSTRTSTVLWSVLSVVLGLGGWFVGVLAVLTVRPALSVDDERLAVYAFGSPVGADIALAWLNPSGRFTRRARNASVRYTGFA